MSDANIENASTMLTNSNEINDANFEDRIQNVFSCYLRLKKDVIQSLLYRFFANVSKKASQLPSDCRPVDIFKSEQFLKDMKMVNICLDEFLKTPSITEKEDNSDLSIHQDVHAQSTHCNNTQISSKINNHILRTSSLTSDLFKTYRDFLQLQNAYKAIFNNNLNFNDLIAPEKNEKINSINDESFLSKYGKLSLHEDLINSATAVSNFYNDHDYFKRSIHPEIQNILTLSDYIMNSKSIGKKIDKSKAPNTISGSKIGVEIDTPHSPDTIQKNDMDIRYFKGRRKNNSNGKTGHSKDKDKSSVDSIISNEIPKRPTKRKYSKANTSNDFSNTLIVPFSPCVPTHIEYIKYSEIVTPQWRQFTFSPHCCIDQNIREDTSDEAFISRHLLFETEEHKKYTLALQFGRRSRKKHMKNKLKMDNFADSGKTISFIPTTDLDLDSLLDPPSPLSKKAKV